jgi:hypothetical protein
VRKPNLQTVPTRKPTHPDYNHPTLGVEQYTNIPMRPFDVTLPDGWRIIAHDHAARKGGVR